MSPTTTTTTSDSRSTNRSNSSNNSSRNGDSSSRKSRKDVKRKLEASANRSKAAAYANSWVKDNDDSSFFQKQAKAINKKQKIMARDASNNTISRKNRKKDEWNEMLDAGKKKKVKGDSTVIGVPSVKTGKNKFQQVQEYNNERR